MLLVLDLLPSTVTVARFCCWVSEMQSAECRVLGSYWMRSVIDRCAYFGAALSRSCDERLARGWRQTDDECSGNRSACELVRGRGIDKPPDANR
jgi:hypothetical protein